MTQSTVTLSIDNNALKHNLKRVRQLAPEAKVLAMVKANAYGHGLLDVAHALDAADAFGVACYDEAKALRLAGIMKKIVLMHGFVNEQRLADCQKQQFDVVVHDEFQINLLEQHGFNSSANIWMKVDTGMHRLGLSPSNFARDYERLSKIVPNKKQLILMSHFSDADSTEKDKTAEQISLFKQLTAEKNHLRSLANSAGILAWDQSHTDWVRPGLMLYGASPFTNKTANDFNLKPVMSCQSRIIAVRQSKKGQSIGYGSNWQCPEDMLVGVVAIGYGDGYPRHAKNGTPVLINDSIVPLVGRVSMDMLSIDLRQAPNAKIGDPVTLWGPGLPVEKVASHADTIPYELLCNIKQVR